MELSEEATGKFPNVPLRIASAHSYWEKVRQSTKKSLRKVIDRSRFAGRHESATPPDVGIDE